MYRRNAQRYFQPAAAANSDHIRSYIYNVLEPSYRKGFSGIGMDFTSNSMGPVRHIGEVVREVNAASAPSLELKYQEDHVPRFRRLESLLRQSDAWRTVAPLQESCSNPFPHVNESASLVRDLALSEVLYTRSNHRLARRAHPKWYTARYRKFMDKKALQEKLMQLKLESGS